MVVGGILLLLLEFFREAHVAKTRLVVVSLGRLSPDDPRVGVKVTLSLNTLGETSLQEHEIELPRDITHQLHVVS
jgi:hypothetical protein